MCVIVFFVLCATWFAIAKNTKSRIRQLMDERSSERAREREAKDDNGDEYKN